MMTYRDLRLAQGVRIADALEQIASVIGAAKR